MTFYVKKVARKDGKNTSRGKKGHPALKAAGIVLAALFILGFFAFTIMAAWVSSDLPDPNILTTRQVPQSTKIYDRAGTHLLYEIHGDQKRTLVKIQDLPNYIKQATIAIEDKNFYLHHGIYWKGLARIAVADIFGGQTQGASTLTQQLVKNTILSREKTLTRKLKEALMALQIEQKYSKDQILQMYLNEIPYGSTIYGIESAAQSYFGKAAKDLTLDEAALLAAIPQAPDYYSPYGTGSRGDNRPRLVVRQHYILDLMAEQGYVTKDEAAAAKLVDTLKKIQPKNMGDIQAPHFVMYVRSMLIEKYGQLTVEQGGLKVITTLDWDKQQAAEKAVTDGVAARGKLFNFSNAALISLDPPTGQIVAMVGSHDFFDAVHDGQVNVTLRPRQPGSSFKPIVYAAGFMKGYLPDTQLWDVNTVFKTDTKDYAPHDYDGKERGPVSIRQALQGSLNIPAVKMLYLVSVGRVLDFAESLGYTTLSDRSRFGLSLVLGGGEVTPLEHAAAFAAFANEGTSYPTSAILSVEDPSGKKLEEWAQPAGSSVMDPQIARLVSNVLSDNNARAYIFGANNSLTLPDRPVAAKTGTTNNNRDAWTAGYTPNLTTVVWVGNNDNTEMKKGADGSIVAAPIWQAYMRKATKGLPVEKFNNPAPPTTDKPAILGRVVQHQVKIDKISGKLATEFTPPDQVEERPTYEAHTILYYVDKDDPTGPAPTNPNADPQFANWEAAVNDWVLRTQWHATDTIAAVFDDVHTVQNQPQVTVLSPAINANLMSRDLNIQASVTAPRPVTRLEAWLDGVLLGGTDASPWTWTVHVPNSFDKGTHTLTVRALDDVGNRGETGLQVNLLAEPDKILGVTIVSPDNGAVWSRATFPKAADIRLDNPAQYQKIELSFYGSDGVRRLVASEANPTANLLHLTIPAGPPVGAYRLVVQGQFQNSDVKEEAQVNITVTQ